MSRSSLCTPLWKIPRTLPSRSLLGQIIGIDLGAVRSIRYFRCLFDRLRTLEAFIQKPCEDLSLMEVCDIADLKCLKPIFQHNFTVVLEFFSFVWSQLFAHAKLAMSQYPKGNLIRQNGKPSGGSTCENDLVLQKGHFGFFTVFVVKVVKAVAGRPHNQAQVDDTRQFTSNVRNYCMSKARQEYTHEAAEHGDDPQEIFVENIPAKPLHGVAVTVFVEFRPVGNSVFCCVEIYHEYLRGVRGSISDPLCPRIARACRGKPVVKSSDGRMVG